MPNHDSPEVIAPTEIFAPASAPVVWVTRPRHRYWVHILLLALTCFTTLVVGARLQWNYEHGLPSFPLDESIFPVLWALRGGHLLLGIPFSVTLMSILLAHELGHYLYCLRYRVAATLPFFIPFPTLIGTLGAFIRIRSPLRSRSILFDIGIAGPIAGFLVALPVLVFTLGNAHVSVRGSAPPYIQLGYPLIFHAVQRFLIWTGHANGIAAVPLSALYLHPMSVAAWVGMFATSLNLLPGGQLDGGHIVYSVSPRAHKTVSRLTIFVLIPLAIFFWIGWFIWAVLLRISGTRHPAVGEWPDVGPRRRWLSLVALAMLVLTFCYNPLSPSDSHQSLLDLMQQALGWVRSLHH